jgi:hypothetical protein
LRERRYGSPSSADSGDRRDLQEGLRIRRQMRSDLAGTDLTALPEGPELRRLMSSFVNACIHADVHSIRQYERGGCGNTTELDRGNAYSATATADKQRFADVWHLAASRLDLGTVSDTDI